MALYAGTGGGLPAKKPPYTADQIAASLAANPQASTGAYGVTGAGQAVGAPMGAAPAAAPAAQQNPFETNPGYLAALAAEQSGSQQADAALRAAQEAAIVGYGDPSIAAALGFGVDANTSAAARANYLAGNSSLARLDKQKGLSEAGNVNNLAAHGILFSGELGYQQGQIGQNYGNAVYDTQQQLLSGLNAAGAQNVATKQGLHSQTTGALTNAYDQYVANPQFYGAAAGATPTVGGATTPQAAADPLAGALAPGVGQIGAQAVTTARRATSRLATTPLRNPYTTGQKRFG